MEVVAAVLERRTGQQIVASRAASMESALRPLLRQYGLADVQALATRLAEGSEPGLIGAVVGTLLNQETSFFRDGGVLEHAVQAIATRWCDRPGERTRIWSAGCSTGQEPLSLAMLFAEHEQRDGRPFPEIQGTDVCAAAIARARAAQYTQFEIQRGLPVRRMLTWFREDQGSWTAQADLVRRVTFRQHNLVGDPPLPGTFDLILCRNVLLYFSPAVRRIALDRLAASLKPDGLLVLGAGETLIGQTEALAPSEAFRGFYQQAPAARSLARRRSASGCLLTPTDASSG